KKRSNTHGGAAQICRTSVSGQENRERIQRRFRSNKSRASRRVNCSLGCVLW
ncbi:hypothetical protein pipiens_018867, partial [Culex pipiens pipiens]